MIPRVVALFPVCYWSRIFPVNFSKQIGLYTEPHFSSQVKGLLTIIWQIYYRPRDRQAIIHTRSIRTYVDGKSFCRNSYDFMLSDTEDHTEPHNLQQKQYFLLVYLFFSSVTCIYFFQVFLLLILSILNRFINKL